MRDVVVVGSGPGGLAAAVTCARAGLDVLLLEAQPEPGGGLRTVDLGLAPGVVHDVCSAVHPLALASPFFRRFDLAARGVRFALPEAAYAHPLDAGPIGTGPAAIAWRDLDRTAAELGDDGAAWRRVFGPLAAAWPSLVAAALGDHRSWPGTTASTTTAVLAARAARLALRTPWTGAGDALFSGVAAHSTGGARSAGWFAAGLLLGSLAHGEGWPVPVGGSRAIADALLADLLAHGGTLETDRPTRRRGDLPRARAYLFDTLPGVVAAMFAGKQAPAYAEAYRRQRPGPGAAKVDLVLRGPVPWADPRVGLASTVHLGGAGAQVRAAERTVLAGQHPQDPYVLVVDPAAHDPGREVDGLRPLWAYTHVPTHSERDVTTAVVGQLERFAPGIGDLVVASRCVPAARMATHNANLEGGDVGGGRLSALGLLSRPTLLRDPYRTGVPGMYLCSAATPPGPGVHGMTGWHAARRALRDVFGIRQEPDLAP